jgi:TatD DNase family protein
MIDSHAHVDGSEFDVDRDEVITRARDAGVTTIVNVGTGDPHSDAFERAVELGRQHEFIYTAIGTHPHDARHYDDQADEKTKHLLRTSERMIAWGEIGLDFHYDNSPRDIQQTVFARQLIGAAELNLPVVIHTREAENETIEILKDSYSSALRCGVFHCFSGTLDLARAALDLGFYLSFSGIVTFKKAEELREVVRYAPLDRLLVETDCPFLAPIPFRGKRNEPAYVIEVAKFVAELKSVEWNAFEKTIEENFASCFGVNQVLP